MRTLTLNGCRRPAACLHMLSLVVVAWYGQGALVSGADPGGSAASIAAEADQDKAGVTLKEGTWKDVEALVAMHKGRIIVVDIWSTSCAPCMTEFPNLVELHKAHPDQLVCISFNVDFVGIRNKPPGFYRERVEKFLKEQKAGFTNLLCSTPADQVFESLELSSIPAVYVFDADGKLARRFDDSLLEDGEEEAFTYKKDVTPFIEQLLKQGKPGSSR